MRARRFPATLRRLLGADDGVAAVEFAMVGPVFFAMMIGTIELCLVMFVNIGIEAAVRDGARYGITGSAPDGTTREEQLRNIIADRTVGLVDMATVQITTKVYPSFTAVGQPEPFVDANGNGQWDSGEAFTDVNGNSAWDPDGGTPGMGGAGEIVLYTISYGLPFIAPLSEKLFDVQVLNLATRIVVRNEPWNPI
jgi:Flp pilus assembly protein TadG